MAPAVIDTFRVSLAVYDMQVVRSLGTSIDTIFEVTGSFLADDGSPAVDPVLAFLAADIRSRVLLHAGRSSEAADWNRHAISLLGQGDLPPGLLGDHLLYEHPAHASILALDLGILESTGSDGEPHRRLDAAIEDLDRRWCTRHQVLLRLFARNTRWRRHLHRARWNLDPALLEQADADLMAERHRWHELLDLHATGQLGMGNSRLSRQWNYVLEHRISEVALLEPERFAFREAGPSDAARRRVTEEPALVAEIRAREKDPGALSTFDLRGLLQGLWLLGESDDMMRDRIARTLQGLPAPARHARWAEWLWRFGTSPHGLVREILEGELDRHRVDSDDPSSGGIARLIALRRASILDELHGGTRWLDSVAAPSGPRSLVDAFEDLRSTPASIMARTPY